MYRTFNGCSHLTELDLSNFDTNNVKNMEQMFSGCGNLTELNLNNFDTSNTTNMSWMFSGCKKLKSIYVTNCNATTIEKIKTAVKSAGLSESIVKTPKIRYLKNKFGDSYESPFLYLVIILNTSRHF